MAKLKFFYSSMGAGKSLDLLRVNDNYRRINKKCLLLKPAIDTRDGKNKISSRIGVSEDCIQFTQDEDLALMVSTMICKQSIDCILIDEAQFLTKDQVMQLCILVDIYNKHVICFGLRTDYNGNTFEGSNSLLGLADELKEIITVCHCERKATMVLRLDPGTGDVIKEDNPESNIHIGDTEYISVCRKHWLENDIGPR